MPLSAAVESILFETDVPEIVLARDRAGTAYLSLLVDRAVEGDTFLCVPASAKRLAALRLGTIDLRDAFTDGETGSVFSARFVRMDDLPFLSLSPVEAIPEYWLPQPGFLLSNYLPEIAPDLAALASEAVASRSSVGVLEFHPPESNEDSRIDAHHLAEGLRLFQVLLHHAYGKAMKGAETLARAMLGGEEAPTIQILPNFARGSFRVHFQSKLEVDLSGSTGVGIALAKLDELTEFVDSPEKALPVLKSNSGHVISAYKSLLYFIATEETPLVYSWSEPGAYAPTRRRIGTDSAKRLYEILSVNQDLSNVEVTFTGTFGKLSEDGKWMLHTENKTIRGLMAEGVGDLLAGVVYQSKSYRIVCDEKLEESIGKAPRKTLYLKRPPEPL